MLYSVVFVMLSCSVCIYSLAPWETFVDRLDLLIRDSFLIIQCNENELEIIRFLTTYEQLQANFKCTNKNQIFQHGIDKVQIIDLDLVYINCVTEGLLRLEVHFNQIKTSLEKEKNGVDWPFVHTPYTKLITNSDPNKFKFLTQKEIQLILTEIDVGTLTDEKDNFFIYLDFVNRPMVCRISINGLQKKTTNGKCKTDVIDAVYEPVCYYKVGGTNTPSHQQVKQIIDKTFSYAKSRKNNYTYISNINTFVVDSNEHIDEQSDSSIDTKTNKEKTLALSMIIIIIICLIVIGIVIFYKKFLKEKKADQLEKPLSEISHESQVSISSKKPDSNNLKNDLPPSSLTQFHNNKQNTKRQAASNRFKLDDDT